MRPWLRRAGAVLAAVFCTAGRFRRDGGFRDDRRRLQDGEHDQPRKPDRA